jgi:signal transduction histidine kinase
MLQVPTPERESRGPLGRVGLAGILIGIVLLLCIGGASVWTAEFNAASLRRAQAIRSVRSAVTGIMVAAQDAETAQRGYLLTADPAYLAPLNSATKRLPPLLDQLSDGLPDDPRQPLLRQGITAKLAELHRTVGLAESGDTADALALVRSNAGLTSMRAIRHLVAGLEDALDERLAVEVSAITRGGRLLIGIDIAGLLMIAAIAGMIGFAIRSYLRVLAQAQRVAAHAYDELERSNEHLDETVRSRTAELSAANEEIQRFAYIVSHDLRAPLVNIMGFTSELEQAATALSRYMTEADAPPDLRDAATEEIPEALRFIKSSTSKMDRLINAILKLSREGQRRLTAERLDMRALFAGMTDTMQHQASSKDAEIIVGSVPDLIADRLAVEQVFGNVIDNALKYLKTDRKGRIRIDGCIDGSAIRYDITDNGRGIAERDYERVFELFRRAGDQSVPGEGIGLAHVRALVRRLGGTIDCKSTPDVGTTFTIRLPIVAHYSREIAA